MGVPLSEILIYIFLNITAGNEYGDECPLDDEDLEVNFTYC